MTILEGLADGIYTAIFWFTMYMLVFQENVKRNRKHRMTFAIIIPLYIMAMIHFAIRWVTARRAFVVNGQTADAALLGFLGQPTWCIALSVITFGVMTLMADLVMIWRCWVVWSCNWRAVIFPLLVVIVEIVFWVFSAIDQIDPDSSLASSNWNTFARPAMIYFILGLTNTAYSTLLIIYRIISVSWKTGFGMSSASRRAMEIIVESAALYCLVLIIYLPLLVRDDFTDGYPQAILIAVTGIAPTIVTARVSLGIARDYSTTQVPSLDFASTGSASALPEVHRSVDSLGSEKTKMDLEDLEAGTCTQ